ncbi:MAG: HD domain-containing protein [Pseudomonadota bacterium]
MGGADTARLMQAAALAARAHDGQRRKGPAGAPYAVHVFDVARLVAMHTDASADAVIAAVLHDTVEDSDTTLDEIQAAFGPAVARIVAGLTDDAATSALPLAERKARQAQKIAAAPPETRLVKLADQTANLTDLPASGDGWSVGRCRLYIAGARAVAEACLGLSSALDAAFDAAAARADNWVAARETTETAA